MANARSTFKTAKGTELPLLNLKGKEYLQVAHRLVWFREAHPAGILKTTMMAHQGEGNAEYAVFKTEVYVDTERGPMCIATGHKKETRGDFPDFIEKCETGSIGRALALAGFGTQFTGDEMNEGNRLADAPVDVIVSGGVSADVGAIPNGNGAGNGSAAVASGRKPSFRKNISAVATGDDI
jgi:hypothetical protein